MNGAKKYYKCFKLQRTKNDRGKQAKNKVIVRSFFSAEPSKHLYDVVVALDKSSYVKYDTYHRLTGLIKGIAHLFKITQHGNHFALVAYNDFTNVRIYI